MSERTPTVWNADEDRMKTLMEFLKLADVSLYSWDIPTIYSSLHAVKRISYAKIGDDAVLWGKKDEDGNEGELRRLFKELEQIKNEYEKGPNKKKNEVEFVNKAEDIYMELNSALQKNGLYFREAEDPTKAALKG